MKKFDFWDWCNISLIVACSIMLFVSGFTKFSEFGVFFMILGTSILNLLRGRVKNTIHNSTCNFCFIGDSVVLNW